MAMRSINEGRNLERRREFEAHPDYAHFSIDDRKAMSACYILGRFAKLDGKPRVAPSYFDDDTALAFQLGWDHTESEQ